MVTDAELTAGLSRLGLDRDSTVQVHASLRSFGEVAGGAETVVDALVDTCGTVMMIAGAWDLTAVPPPPGLVRPDNAVENAASWDEFDAAVERATPYAADLPVSRWLGVVADVLCRRPGALRGPHPLFSYTAVGANAQRLISADGVASAIEPLRELAALDGDVVLLGVDHTSDTAIHVAEQDLHRGLFFRYARGRDGLWVELPRVSGASHRFDELEPALRPFTTETVIGHCRARRIKINDVVRVATETILADPKALLCENPGCRCAAALRQRLAHLDAS